MKYYKTINIPKFVHDRLVDIKKRGLIDSMSQYATDTLIGAIADTVGKAEADKKIAEIEKDKNSKEYKDRQIMKISQFACKYFFDKREERASIMDLLYLVAKHTIYYDCTTIDEYMDRLYHNALEAVEHYELSFGKVEIALWLATMRECFATGEGEDSKSCLCALEIYRLQGNAKWDEQSKA